MDKVNAPMWMLILENLSFNKNFPEVQVQFVCICTHMKNYKLWTCQHNVYRLKNTTNKLADWKLINCYKDRACTSRLSLQQKLRNNKPAIVGTVDEKV